MVRVHVLSPNIVVWENGWYENFRCRKIYNFAFREISQNLKTRVIFRNFSEDLFLMTSNFYFFTNI